MIMDKLKIKPNEVMTIGDNINDKEMIENAKIGVVMGNSALDAMRIGESTIADNNSSGVAEAIEKFILH